MLDYDVEAPDYDRTRGGTARPAAAAAAIASLLPAGTRTLLDVAGGTGSVGTALTGHGLSVLVADASLGMLALAASRLPGRVLRADARRLPIADRSVDAVTSVWLLHLLPGPADVAAVVAEAARVLRPGGVYLTTVDRSAAHLHRPADPAATDAVGTVTAVAARSGLIPAGSTRFIGVGQGRPGVGDGSDPVFTLLSLRRG